MEVFGIGGAVLVDDHEVDVEPLQSPVLVRPQQLAHDVDVVELIDADDHDRQIPGDPVRPECCCPEPVAGEHALGRP